MRNENGRGRKAILTGAAALGMALGSVGVGWAISPGPASSPAPPVQVQATTQAAPAQDEPTEAVEPNQAAEPAEANEADEVQDPSYTASITAPEDESASEADEAKALEGLATISADQAREAALAAVPGTVDKVELDNENGAVVYSVEITDSSGSHVDVKVDAGNGTVVHQDAGGDNEG